MKSKRLLLITTVLSVLVYLSGCSDKMYVNRALTWAENGERLDTALKSVNKATELEETKDWAKTYYTKGFVYQKIYETKNPEYKDLVEEPLVKAFKNYKEAYKLDEKGTYKGSIDATMFKLHQYFINEGVDGFNEKNFDKAFKSFKYALKVSDMPIFDNRIDTAIIFNAGVAAQQLKKWEEAAKYYKEAAEYGYQGPKSYLYLNHAYMQMEDTTKALNALKDGFEKYPNNDRMTATLVNHYLLNSDHPEKGLKYLDKAIEQNPDNAEYYFAKGQIYDNIDQLEKAKENYKKALEINPDHYLSLYNIGVIYYNKGVDLESKANKTKEEEKYKELKKKAEDKFLEALPYMEKAAEVKPKELSLLQTLKTLYYRLRVKNPKYLEKYKQLNQKIEKLKEQKSENK